MLRFPFTFSPLELLKDVRELKCLSLREGQNMKTSHGVLLFQPFSGACRKDFVFSCESGSLLFAFNWGHLKLCFSVIFTRPESKMASNQNVLQCGDLC